MENVYNYIGAKHVSYRGDHVVVEVDLITAETVTGTAFITEHRNHAEAEAAAFARCVHLIAKRCGITDLEG